MKLELFRTIRLLIALTLLIIIFGMETWAFMPRIPTSLLLKSGDIVHDFVKPGERIVGGKHAVHGELPYQASLQKISFFGTKTHYCGGTLISPICVITAGHCLDGRHAKDVLVRLGSNSLKNDPVAIEMPAEDLIIHPQYDPNTIHSDIGILKLKHPISYKVNVNRVPLPEFKANTSVDTHCTISGWGSIKEGGVVSKSLMYADVPIISDDKCRDHYGKSEISEQMMCAGYTEGGIDSCQGDSGGPMVCDGRLSGVVSWGIGCARPKYPGVYTQVSYYTKWIESQGCFDEKSIQGLNTDKTPEKNFTFNSLFPMFQNGMFTFPLTHLDRSDES